MWSTVLKMIPWGQVIDHAPEVIDAAKRLYAHLRQDAPATSREVVVDNFDEDLSELERLQRLAESNRDELIRLHQDVEASSKIINALAEQHAQMIEEIETLRKRIRRVGWLTVFAFITVFYLIYRITL